MSVRYGQCADPSKGNRLRAVCVAAMGVNLYAFVGARAATMAQMGTHNGFRAPTYIIKAPTTILPLGHPQARSHDFVQEGANLARAQGTPNKNRKLLGFGPLFLGSRPTNFYFF